MKKSLFLSSVMIIALSCGSSQKNSSTTTSSQPVDPTEYGTTITSAELKEMLYEFASDEFAGRETGQPGQKLAVEYLKQHYVSLGIASPLKGDNYFQKVNLANQKTPVTQVSINGTTFENFKDIVSSGSAKTQTFSVNDIVYAGYGIEDEAYSDYKNIDVKGKVVIIKTGEPKNADGTFVTTGKTEATKWSAGRQATAFKRDVAVNKGAIAILTVDNAQLTQYATFIEGRIKSGRDGRIVLTDKPDGIKQFIVSENFAKAIHPDLLSLDSSKKIDAKLTFNITSEAEAIDSENVVAYIKGSEKPDEIIVISAHLDHEGIKDGEIYNGADDDGSGSVAILEIAEAFKKAADAGHGPKRSILFLHVTAEEKGLLGSSYYTDISPIFPLENTVANLNIDMIGRIDPKRVGDRNYVYLIGSDKLSTELHNLSEEVNSKYANIVLDYKYNDENDPNRYYYRSDHYNFAKNNIPVIFYFNGTHDDYHKSTDTVEKIEYDLLENRTRLVFYTAWELANRPSRVMVDKDKLNP